MSNYVLIAPFLHPENTAIKAFFLNYPLTSDSFSVDKTVLSVDNLSLLGITSPKNGALLGTLSVKNPLYPQISKLTFF